MDSKEPVSTAPAWAASTLATPTALGAGAEPLRAPSPFDVCHVGVVLRVVAGVQLVLGLGLSFGAQGPAEALARWAQAAVWSLPASMSWLVLACAARAWLARAPSAGQWAVAIGLGVGCGAMGRGVSVWLDHAIGLAPDMRPWGFVPPMLAGGALAAAALAWLKHRAHSQLPAHTEARLSELQARIRPHFLFNTLNTAIALVQIDPQRAEAVLEDLAELFRQALASPSLRSTVAEEVALAQRYLHIEALRFGERMTVRWELDAQADAAEVPALVLQPLVENAVRHGIEANPLGGWVVVRTKVQGGRMVLTVSNSVPVHGPAEPTAGHGMALRNVRQRLRLMHDVEAEFEAGLQRGDGRQPPVYVVRLAVPLPADSAGWREPAPSEAASPKVNTP